MLYHQIATVKQSPNDKRQAAPCQRPQEHYDHEVDSGLISSRLPERKKGNRGERWKAKQPAAQVPKPMAAEIELCLSDGSRGRGPCRSRRSTAGRSARSSSEGDDAHPGIGRDERAAITKYLSRTREHRVRQDDFSKSPKVMTPNPKENDRSAAWRSD